MRGKLRAHGVCCVVAVHSLGQQPARIRCPGLYQVCKRLADTEGLHAAAPAEDFELNGQSEVIRAIMMQKSSMLQ